MGVTTVSRYKGIVGTPLDRAYYERLTEPSPADSAAPMYVRDHPSHPSSQAFSVHSGVSTPSGPHMSSGGGSPVSSTVNESVNDAWKREVKVFKIQMESCLLDLAHAVSSEDFERASQLKARRQGLQENFKCRLLAPPLMDGSPQQQQRDSQHPHGPAVKGQRGVYDSQASIRSDTHSDHPSLDSQRTSADRPRSDNGGLTFLFSVLQHNPRHTPIPDNLHH